MNDWDHDSFRLPPDYMKHYLAAKRLAVELDRLRENNEAEAMMLAQDLINSIRYRGPRATSTGEGGNHD